MLVQSIRIGEIEMLHHNSAVCVSSKRRWSQVRPSECSFEKSLYVAVKYNANFYTHLVGIYAIYTCENKISQFVIFSFCFIFLTTGWFLESWKIPPHFWSESVLEKILLFTTVWLKCRSSNFTTNFKNGNLSDFWKMKEFMCLPE